MFCNELLVASAPTSTTTAATFWSGTDFISLFMFFFVLLLFFMLGRVVTFSEELKAPAVQIRLR